MLLNVAFPDVKQFIYPTPLIMQPAAGAYYAFEYIRQSNKYKCIHTQYVIVWVWLVYENGK